MASPRAIVSVKATRGGSGTSGVARYIAQSKLDREREGTVARPLFSNTQDGMSYWVANKLISPDHGGPEKEDVIHLVISTTEEEFNRLGSNQEERLAALKEITRDTAREIEVATNVEQLHWFAGIHLNTDNPHVHMAIGRDAVSLETNETTRITHLPRTLLPHNEKTHDGVKDFTEGDIATRFVTSLNIMQQRVATREYREMTREREGAQSHDQQGHNQQRTETGAHERQDEPQRESQKAEPSPRTEKTNNNSRGNDSNESRSNSERNSPPDSNHTEPQEPVREEEVVDRTWKDRFILGRAMVARGEVERLTSALSGARMHGDKRRFRIYDSSHDRTRRMSEFDIKRRADARAYREVSDRAILDKTVRHQNRQKLFDRDVQDHEHGIHHHQVILQKTIRKIESDLKDAQREYGNLRPKALGIKRDYETAGKPLPLPLISGKELTKLQNQAVAAKNPTRLNALEQIRQSLIIENKECRRTDNEAARLRGQLLMSETDQKMAEKRLADFERSRHLTRWDLGGKKWSLADVDKQLTERAGEAKFFNSPVQLLPAGILPQREIIRVLKVLGRNSNLLPSGRRRAREEIKNLTEIRGQVELKIADRRASLQNEITKAAALTESLTGINDREMSARRITQRNIPAQLLTQAELHRLESSALSMKDISLLKRFQVLETESNKGRGRERKGQVSPEISAGRAVAREILAEVAWRESQEKLGDFKHKEKFVPVLVKDAKGRDTVASPHDFRQQRKLVHHIAERLLESNETKEMRHAVERAVITQESHLNQEITNAREIYELAIQTSENFQQQLGIERPAPIFTPKEINTMEIYATKHSDYQVASQYMQIINEAEKDGRVFTTEAEERDRTLLAPGQTQPDRAAAEHPAFASLQQDAAREAQEQSFIEDLDLTH